MNMSEKVSPRSLSLLIVYWLRNLISKNSTETAFSGILILMSLFFAQHKTRKATAGLLALWLSGFVLLFCCGAMEARAETEFCPLAKAKSHCDKTNAAKTDVPSFSAHSGLRFDCCGFLPAVFDKARKIEKNQQTANIAEQLKIERPVFSFVRKDSASANFYRPPPFPRKKIFIVNRVFRI
jgi:hypothetical protein